MKRFLVCVVLVAVLAGESFVSAADGGGWRAGVATRKLTPPGPIWMAGYANRIAPSDGVELDVFGKALALDDGRGARVVIVTLDLIGVPRALRTYVEREAGARHGLKPAEILLNASHTHSAPLPYANRIPLERNFSVHAKPADVAALERFERELAAAVMDLIGESLRALQPVNLEFSQARAGFAMNRRRPEPNGTFSNNPNPDGPVDHDVPVLRVTRTSGGVLALLFGYACHNTTLSGSKISGDYAGYAKRALEASYPGVTALFLLGCAGDQNPYPRGNMVPDQEPAALAQQHGRELANAVSTALATRMRPVRGPLRGAYGFATLPYDAPTAEQLAAYTPKESTPPVLERARALRESLARGEKLPPFECPVQVLRFGADLTLVAIAGEATVDYSLRLKRELKGAAAVWVAAYSNDVFGYLGSRRVIEEGGYEGISANTRILNHPGRFNPSAEDRVIEKVHALLAETGK